MIRTYYNAKIYKSVYFHPINIEVCFSGEKQNHLVPLIQSRKSCEAYRFYCFQNPGSRIVNTVNISRRPIIIRKDRNHFETVGTSA